MDLDPDFGILSIQIQQGDVRNNSPVQRDNIPIPFKSFSNKKKARKSLASLQAPIFSGSQTAPPFPAGDPPEKVDPG